MTLFAAEDLVIGILSLCERLPLWLAIPTGLVLFAALCLGLAAGKEWWEQWTGEKPKDSVDQSPPAK
jgi:hypothetical protein